MGIVRFENVTVNTVTNGVDSIGEYTTTNTPWFTSRARIRDVSNSLLISEKYRVYTDLVNITFNYTPWVKQIVDAQNAYSITWRNQDWRITDIKESDDRMSITFLCYYNSPSTPV